MKKVMAFGTFDLLHEGHLKYLEEAKKIGDELIVVVACDDRVRKEKKREPVVPEESRRRMVEALKPVDRAVVGYKEDMFRVLQEEKPDILALGPDQYHSEAEIRKELGKRGLNIRVVRIKEYVDGAKTRKMIEKIKNSTSD